MDDSQLQSQLINMAHLYAGANLKKNFYRLVLDNGRTFKAQPLPAEFAQRTPKECFKNATELAIETGLTYVEGFVFRILPIHHAWCVDEHGNVIDPTLKDPEDCEYFGIPFDTNFLVKFLTDAGYYSVMFNPNGMNILEMDPSEFISNDV